MLLSLRHGPELRAFLEQKRYWSAHIGTAAAPDILNRFIMEESIIALRNRHNLTEDTWQPMAADDHRSGRVPRATRDIATGTGDSTVEEDLEILSQVRSVADTALLNLSSAESEAAHSRAEARWQQYKETLPGQGGGRWMHAEEAYNIQIEYGRVDTYHSTRIVRSEAQWFYVGVTHEYMTNGNEAIAVRMPVVAEHSPERVDALMWRDAMRRWSAIITEHCDIRPLADADDGAASEADVTSGGGAEVTKDCVWYPDDGLWGRLDGAQAGYVRLLLQKAKNPVYSRGQYEAVLRSQPQEAPRVFHDTSHNSFEAKKRRWALDGLLLLGTY